MNPVDYFKEHEKNTQSLGMELEHLILNEKGEWTPYEVVRGILEELVSGGMDPILIDGFLLGAKAEDYEISLEPGSQFELSIAPKTRVSEIEASYEKALQTILPVIEKRGLRLVTMGYQPVTDVHDITIIPKKRYHAMQAHFLKTDRLGIYMMRASASTQVSIDYSSEADFKKKFQLANRLAPYLSLLFDNSPFIEGRPQPHELFRTEIWLHTDNSRSNVMKGSLKEDFSYHDVIETYRKLRPIVMPGPTGSMEPVEGTVEELTDLTDRSVLEHVLSMAFFDVRAKGYLEIRMIDSLPKSYVFSVAALIKGIFYTENLEYYSNLLKDMKEEDIFALKETFMREGYTVEAKAFLKELVERAKKALGEEGKYLDVLVELVEKGETLSKRMKELGLKECLDFETVRASRTR
ncbi:glutamate-cysteine ligase family protein [Guggenheimella bovis]